MNTKISWQPPGPPGRRAPAAPLTLTITFLQGISARQQALGLGSWLAAWAPHRLHHPAVPDQRQPVPAHHDPAGHGRRGSVQVGWMAACHNACNVSTGVVGRV
jgi:hypothetical protein